MGLLIRGGKEADISAQVDRDRTTIGFYQYGGLAVLAHLINTSRALLDELAPAVADLSISEMEIAE